MPGTEGQWSLRGPFQRRVLPDARILDYKFSIDDGRITVAREYGFKDWGEAGRPHEPRRNCQISACFGSRSGKQGGYLRRQYAAPALRNEQPLARLTRVQRCHRRLQ